MSNFGALLTRLTDLGVPPETAAQVLHEAVTIGVQAAALSAGPTDKGLQVLERRRAFDRERKRRRNAECPPAEWDALRRQVFERDDWKCTYCGSRADLQCDHVTPFSKGGLSTLDNLTTACAACNNAKKALSVEEWMGAQ